MPDTGEAQRRRNRVLTFIAVFKFVKATALFVVAFGAAGLVHTGVAAGVQQSIAVLTSGVDRRFTQRLLARASGLTASRVEALGIGAFLYAALFMVEGIGLWRERRWAEYLTIVATASFIPFEVYEVVQNVTAVRVSALAVNVAVVSYLIERVRTRRRR